METTETRKKLADGIRQLQSKGDTASVEQLVSAYKVKYQSPVETSVAPTSTATFPAVAGENPLVAGAKAIGNLPQSTYQFGKGIVGAIASPIQTIKSIGGILGGAGTKVLESTVGKGIETVTGRPIQKTDTEAFNAFTNVLKERYGSLDALQKTATEDPFAFGADVLSVLEGGAGLVGKTAQLNRAVGTVGRTAIAPVTKTISRGADVVGGTTKFGLSQLTGLKSETITKLVKDPEAFKNVSPEIRMETATKVADVLDERLGELSDMGKGYQTIRESGGLVTVPPNTIKDVLNKYGVKLDEGNKIITSPESRPLSAGDKVALQDFIDNYGGVTTHTNNSFLNTREALSNLAKYDTTKTNLSTQIARDLRQEYDKFGKAQVKGLKDLDTAYAPERELLGQLKKDLIDSKTGDLKDAAISKIANLTGKGKEQVLERVKQIIPDIEERIDLLKAVEDIENASGFKVGTYTRSGVGIAGIATGNIPAIVAAIVAQPSIAVPLLKGAGYVGQKAIPVLRALRDIANDVNNFTIPASFKNKEGQVKLGMSIEDVSKSSNAGSQSVKALETPQTGLNKSLPKTTTELQSVQQPLPKGISKELEKDVRFYVKKDVPITRENISIDNIRGKGLKTGEIPSGKEDLTKPVIVAKMEDGSYQLLDGRHRLDVLQKQGKNQIDAIVADKSLSKQTGALSAQQAVAKGISKEEWIKGQGTTVYSGGSQITKEWSNEKLGGFGTIHRGRNELGGGIYITDSPEYAKTFGSQLTESSMKSNLKLLDIRESSKAIGNAQLNKIKAGFKSYDNYLKNGGEELLPTDYPDEILNKIQSVYGGNSTDILKKAGFDGIVGDESRIGGQGGTVWNIFDAENLKTPSQLSSLYDAEVAKLKKK